MKRAPLTVFGAIVSFFVGAVMQPAAAGDPRAAAIRGQLSAHPDAHDKTRSTVEVPRGNLRGDIVKNVRSRLDAPRGGAGDRRPHETDRPDPR